MEDEGLGDKLSIENLNRSKEYINLNFCRRISISKVEHMLNETQNGKAIEWVTKYESV